MGMGGIGIWQLLIILAIVLLLFGTKRLRNLGGDLGGAIKGFKKAVSSDEDEDKDKKTLTQEEQPNPATTSNASTPEKPKNDVS